MRSFGVCVVPVGKMGVKLIGAEVYFSKHDCQQAAIDTGRELAKIRGVGLELVERDPPSATPEDRHNL